MADFRTGGNGLPYVTPDETVQKPLWWQKQGLQYTASGYGKRIPTSWMARIGKRWYRVYCCIYSNIGTIYVTIKGKDHIVEGV